MLSGSSALSPFSLQSLALALDRNSVFFFTKDWAVFGNEGVKHNFISVQLFSCAALGILETLIFLCIIKKILNFHCQKAVGKGRWFCWYSCQLPTLEKVKNLGCFTAKIFENLISQIYAASIAAETLWIFCIATVAKKKNLQPKPKFWLNSNPISISSSWRRLNIHSSNGWLPLATVFLDVSKKYNDSQHTNILAIYKLWGRGGWPYQGNRASTFQMCYLTMGIIHVWNQMHLLKWSNWCSEEASASLRLTYPSKWWNWCFHKGLWIKTEAIPNLWISAFKKWF